MACAKIAGGSQTLYTNIDNAIVLDAGVYEVDSSDYITVDTTNSQFVVNTGGAGKYLITANSTVDGSNPGDTVTMWIAINGVQPTYEQGVSHEFNYTLVAGLTQTVHVSLQEEDTVSLMMTLIAGPTTAGLLAASSTKETLDSFFSTEYSTLSIVKIA